VTCAHCKADIEDDSFYCDQCGKEVLLCSKCGTPGSRRVCTTCGATLVPAKNKASATPVQSAQPEATSSIVQPNVARAANGGATRRLQLLNRNLNLDLEVADGDILGRTAGRFAAVLSRQERISGRHASFRLDPGRGWSVSDLGSTNGTRINGVRLPSGQAHELRDGCLLQIANIEFYVQVSAPAGPTGTVRDDA